MGMGLSLVSCLVFFCFFVSWLEAVNANENARTSSSASRAEFPKSDCFFIHFPPDVGENSMIHCSRFVACGRGFGLRMSPYRRRLCRLFFRHECPLLPRS